MLKVCSLNTRLSKGPAEIVLRIVDFMFFDDFLNFRHASAWFFRFSTTWETPLVASFLKSYQMGVADRLFRTLAPEGPAKMDYFVRLWRRCITADTLANDFINYPLHENNFVVPVGHNWLWQPVRRRFIPSTNVDKLKRCLLIYNHFFESLHVGLAKHFAVETMETQLQQDDSAFLKVEATVLSRYTPDAINRLLGVHEYLIDVIASKREYKPPLTLVDQIEQYVFDHFFFRGQPDLGTANKISSIHPDGYVPYLGFGWGSIVDRDNAFAKFADYVMSDVDDDDDMLVQDT